VAHEPVSYRLRGESRKFSVGCEEGYYKDIIRVLDMNGAVTEEVPIFDALLASPFHAQLSVAGAPDGPHDCDPLHTNSVTPLGPEFAAKFPDLKADDLLVSLRNLSALAIIGRSDHKIKLFIKGNFMWQHSAHPLPDGRIVLFDDFGIAEETGASRVMILDPLTQHETTVFPNAQTPEEYPTFTPHLGRIDLSRDRTRALVAYGSNGRGYEIDLTTGALLTAFDNVRDLRPARPHIKKAEMAGRNDEHGLYYIYPDVLAHLR